MNMQEDVTRGDATQAPFEALIEEIGKLDDPHVKDIEKKRLIEVEEAVLRMYEKYTGLQADFDVNGYSEELFGQVEKLGQELKWWSHSGSSVGQDQLPDDPTVNFLAMVNNKVSGLFLKLQMAKRKAA